MAFSQGSRLGVYEILAPIGSGGMGEVYRARDTRLGRDVALKFLPETFASDPDRVARFGREAKTLASLNHPHIAQIYGLEDRALVMELVDGEDLAQRIARGPIPIDEALPIARQIAEAIEAAHERGIIHRDLKPANIKMREDGTVKVLDFGLAKALDPVARDSSPANPAILNSPTITSPAMTAAGMILGTAAYMSPEQAKGRPVDKRADVWSFGCVLYEMLTGRRAFDGEDVTDTLAAILRSEPDWTALASSPPVMQMLIKRCIDRDTRRRIGDISAVRFVLDDPTVFAPAAVAATGSVPAAAAAPRARISVSTVVALAVVAAFSVIATYAVTGRRIPPPPAPVTRFVLPLPVGQVLQMSRRMMAISPDGQSLAFVAGPQLLVRRFAQFDNEPLQVSENAQGITSPTFSPDGMWVAFHSAAQNGIRRVSIQGGPAQRVCDTALPWTMAWDGDAILLGMGTDGVLRCNPAGGAPEQIVKPASGEAIMYPQLLTGDAILLSVVTMATANITPLTGDGQIVVQSLKDGQRRVLASSATGGYVTPTGHLIYLSAGVLYAQPFDIASLTARGHAVPVIEGISRGGPARLSLSPGGTLVYVPGAAGTAADNRYLTVANRAGTMTRLTLAPGAYTQVRVSPDGKQVVLASEDDKDASLWVYALDGSSAPRRLTLTGQSRFPVWSPDGRWLAFQFDLAGDAGIFRQRADGSGSPERLTTAEAGVAHIPEAWSPDGRHLAFAIRTVKAREQFALWVLSLADKKASSFGGVTSIQATNAVFSPDGRWLAYAGTPTDDTSSPSRGVFVRSFPAADTVLQAPRQLVDFHPLWSRDGKELFFLASATARQMAAMRVTPSGESLTFGTPARFPAALAGDRLSNAPRPFDVLPDGRFIGLAGPADTASASGSAELRVVLNWLEELKQRVPVR